MPQDQPLAGRVVGITAERRATDQAVMFERLGAEVILAPTMHTSPVADLDQLKRVTEEFVSSPPDYLIANTGMGIRAWLENAKEWGMDGALVDAMRSVRIAARGPKAAGALSSSKLEVWWRSPTEQLAELSAHLLESGVSGKRVAFQLHGDSGGELTSRLEDAGAAVIPVPVYRWSAPEGKDADPALQLIDRSCAGEVDAVTFTAGPQVRNLIALAESHGRATELLVAFESGRPLAACIGPVCARVANEEGVPEPLVPENWRLGSLVKAVSAALGPAGKES
ncbi:MAG TPA: uroporphyrinogen-III synthase [Acidimicrobiales bacterium]|nr:uroporphyrinogen-III synthase [Acidimicrobiales bacterium]